MRFKIPALICMVSFAAHAQAQPAAGDSPPGCDLKILDLIISAFWKVGWVCGVDLRLTPELSRPELPGPSAPGFARFVGSREP